MIAPGRILSLWLLAALAFLATAGSALAQDNVQVRAFQHSDFARIVFDWPALAGYGTTLAGQSLTVRFDRAFQADLGPIQARLPDYVAAVSAGADGQSITIDLSRPVTLADFTNENSVVVDLRPSAEPVLEQAATPTPASSSGQEAQSPAVSGSAPADAVRLGVRVGEHPTYSRIVFDWPSATPYTVERDGRALTVTFSRAAQIDVAALEARLPAGIRPAAVAASQDGTVVTFAVPQEADINHFPLEEKVVIDVLASAALRAAPAEALTPDQLPQVAQAPPPTTTEPAATPQPEPEPPTEPEVSIAPSVQDAVEEALAPSEEELDRRADAALADALEEGTVEFRAGFEPDIAAEEEEVPAARDPIPPPELTATPAETQDPVDAAQPATEDAVETADDDDAGPAIVSYTFSFGEDVGAAVFRRADNIWIVFDQSRELDLSKLRTEGEVVIERLDQLPIGGATVLRMFVPNREVNAAARREGFSWVVDFRGGPQRPEFQMPIAADVTTEIGPHLNFPSDTPGRTINVPDPEQGDLMRVATLLESGVGMDGLRRYPEFLLLPTAQGIVVINLSDRVLLDRNFDGFQVSAPDGLAISAVSPEAPVSSGPVLSARRLFDWEGLMRGGPEDYLEQSQALKRSIAETPEEKLNAARLNYAGFLLAHDRAQEALGVLRVVERADAQLMQRIENRALIAAALVLAKRLDEAEAVLNDARFDGFAEASIWRATSRALAGDVRTSEELFRLGDSLLTRYPYPLKAKLGLARIEVAFSNKMVPLAEAWIDSLERDRDQLQPSQQAELDFQRGQLAALLQRDFDLASETYEEVMASGDRKFAYRAEQSFIAIGLRQGTMDTEEAIERYERLRYAWRGDRAELVLLKRLGGLYLENGGYFEGLEAYRTAVRYFPEDQIAVDLAGEMTEVFGQLFLEGVADELAPLRAVALFEEFKELTPAGEVGDQLIENIADRLTAIDLLPEAAEKLEELLADEDRLPPGEERARLSAKLAFIYLMDGKAGLAEEALKLGPLGAELLDFSPDLEADRDRLLARVRFQQARYDDAIKELAGDVTEEADLLRRDIYRTTLNWQESAKVLQRLAGNPPQDPSEGIEGEQARFVINWAVALFQNQDRDGLRDLIDLWGPTMANSSLSGVFDYITTQENAPTGGNVLETVDQLIGADRYDAFLSAYRERLFAEPEPQPLEVSATSS